MNRPTKKVIVFTNIAIVLSISITLLSLSIWMLAPDLLYGKMTISNLSMMTSEILPGDSATAIVTIQNSGLFPATGALPVWVDGNKILTPEVYLYGNSQKEVPITLTGYSIGLHRISAGTQKQYFKVLKPASFKVYDLGIKPARPVVGQEMEVRVKVKNTGDIKGTYTAYFNVFDRDQRPLSVTLEPGEEKIVSRKLIAERSNTPAKIDSLSLDFSTVLPASIHVYDMQLSRKYIKSNGKSTITVFLNNLGDLAGKMDLVVKRDGKQYKTMTVEVSGNSETQVAFEVSETKPGKHKYSVGAIYEELIVVTKSRPKNGTFLYGTQNDYEYNSLTIINNYSTDVIVVVQKNEYKLYERKEDFKTVCIVYVRAKSKFKILDVSGEVYRVFYSYGADYSPERKGFMTNAKYVVFGNHFYNEMFSRTQYTITLNPSGKGNAKTYILNEFDFPG